MNKNESRKEIYLDRLVEMANFQGTDIECLDHLSKQLAWDDATIVVPFEEE